MKKNFSPKQTDPKALDNYVQTEGQSAGASIADVKAPASSNSTIKEVETPKPAINTIKAAEAVAAGSVSEGSMAAFTRGRPGVVFSGGAGAISGDMSATTGATASYRSGDRTGRRADPITRKLDLLVAEIVDEKIDQSKPLAETDAKQGYNGNYANEHARTQKANGGSPADPMFMRSLDEIDMDMLYYADGQYVKPRFGVANEIDIHSYNETTGQFENHTVGGLTPGSYVGRSFHFTVTRDGEIEDFGFTSDDITPETSDEVVARAASDAFIRSVNRSELDRATMIEKASNENDPGWSPLPIAIRDASGQNRFLAAFEASIGDIVYTSRRKLSTALSYQINKTAKDGSIISGPIAEMCNGNVASLNDNGALASYAGNGWDATFGNVHNITNGSAALYVAINDSTTKYNTKGKFMTLPLSFRTALNIAESNAGPLKMHQQLEELMAKNELFSTIDGPYDGVKPVVVTDGCTPVLPIDLFQLGTNPDDKFAIYTMHYENLRMKYNITIRNYFASGLYTYIRNRASNLWNAYATAYRQQHHVSSVPTEIQNVTFNIPIVSTTTSISLWDLLVCAATPHMVDDRIICMTALLDYENKHGYPYSGITTVGSTEVCKAENFSFSSTDSPLVTAIAKPVAAMKVIMPELFWPVQHGAGRDSRDHEGVVARVVLPHYFVQNQFQATEYRDLDDGTTDHPAYASKLILSDEYGTMAYPSVRPGSRFGFLDTIYGMSEEDYRLSLDRMVTYPGYSSFTGGKDDFSKLGFVLGGDGVHKNRYGTRPSLTYKYGFTADGQPVVDYFAYSTSASDSANTLTVHDILVTPRELGLVAVSPAGYLTPVRRAVDGNAPNRVDESSAFFGVSGPGFKFKIYRANNTQAPGDEILHNNNMAIDLQSSLQGVWTTFAATPVDAYFNQGWCVNEYAAYRDVLSPFTTGGMDASEFDFDQGTYGNAEQHYNTLRVRSTHKYLWTRLQRLPFAINPFDANCVDITNPEVEANNDYDIYDFLYIFGLCGFRASDYSELLYDRHKQRIAYGMNYIHDPFVDKSMLLK